MLWKKKWQVSLSYEVNRLAADNLADTYEKLFPKKQYKINPSKEAETNSEQQHYLQQSQGYLK